MNAFADEVEQLHESAAELPRFLGEAVEGVAVYAAAIAELVGSLDARRQVLNERGQSLGVPPIPDLVGAYVPSLDAVRASLVAAARRGPGELAVALGKAARGPAGLPGAAAPYEAETLGDAARAAAALLTQAHHEVEEVRAQDLVAGADPVKAAMVLAAVAVKLAREVMAEEDVTTWIAELGAVLAVDGDD